MITRVDIHNVNVCAQLAHQLWPHAELQELANDFSEKIASINDGCFLYVDETNQNDVGFIHISLRNDYVEGCASSPVAYIEGIYVIEGYRRKGIANKLLEAGERWAKEKGCTEIASDCELENQLSIDFHKGIGFQEANRIVCFNKKL